MRKYEVKPCSIRSHKENTQLNKTQAHKKSISKSGNFTVLIVSVLRRFPERLDRVIY